jgi:VanZ family protein
MSKLKSLKPFIPAGFFAVLIIIGSSIPPEALNQEILSSDKASHFVAFSILAILFCIGYVNMKKIRFWYVRAAAASLFVGVLTEVIQFFIPYRSFSIEDLGADVAGIITALVFFAAIFGIYSKKKAKV